MTAGNPYRIYAHDGTYAVYRGADVVYVFFSRRIAEAFLDYLNNEVCHAS